MSMMEDLQEKLQDEIDANVDDGWISLGPDYTVIDAWLTAEELRYIAIRMDILREADKV